MRTLILLLLWVSSVASATTVYPGSLDNFTNPTGASFLSPGAGGRTHSQMHGDLNDAIEALQALIGVTGSAVTGSFQYRMTAAEAAISGMISASSTTTFTNKTINGASNTLTVLAGSQLSGQVPLTNGGTAANLSDPNGDRILFWDDSASEVTWATLASPLSFTGQTIECGGCGGGGSGTVTSINVSGGTTGLSFTGGAITTSGTITASGVVVLANGGTGASLADPNADRLMMWDDSAGSTVYAKAGSGLSVSGTTATAVSGLGGLYGDSSAGSLTSSSGVTTVSAVNQIQYGTVTLTGTATVYTSGRVFYVDTLDLSGAPARAVNVDGGAASGTTAGTSLADTGRQTPAVGLSGNAGASATGGGVSSATLSTGRIILTSDSASYASAGRGGNGGAGSGGAGGTSGLVPDATSYAQMIVSTPVQPASAAEWARPFSAGTSLTGSVSVYSGTVNGGSTGGAGGGGNGSALGTAGGGGGGTAGPLIVYARHIIVSASTPACVLSASGGLGASSSNATNNNTGTGGGGGGGQGGLVIVVTDSVTATDSTTSVTGAICADGAAGGSAGTPMGTGVAGTGGYSGRGGRIIFWNRGLGTTSYAGPTAGNAPSGATGGTIAQARVNLVVN